MAIKFLSGLNLSNVTAGSILKLDSNGNIVAATAGTDYVSSSTWSTASNDNIYYNSGGVRIGTYQQSIDAAAQLHVFDYQTTDPKLLIEDGNTGDASMQFKISTQQYTMGIDNSDEDKFVLAASSALGTTNVLEVATNGTSAFQTGVLFKETIYMPGNGQTADKEKLIDAHGTRATLYKGGNAVYWQVAQGGNQFQIVDAANGNDSKGNVLLHVSGNDADDNVLYLATASGKVSIGSQTAPSATLQVAGDDQDGVRVTGGTNGRIVQLGGSELSFYTTSTSGWAMGNTVRKNSDSSVLGYISGGFGTENSLTYTYYGGTAYNNAAMYIRSSNVGIGTNDPAQKLEVVGTIQATSTGTATLILRGDSGNSGDTGQLDSTIKMLHDDGNHGILLETRNYAGAQSFEIKSLASGTETSRFLIDTDGTLKIPAYGAGFLTTDANGDVSVDTTSYVDITGDTMTGDLTIKRGHGDLTFLTLKQENTSGDLVEQKSFIDFTFVDSNTNETPQVRIGAEVGNNDGSASSLSEEGMGAFVVYTNNADTDEGDAGTSLAERFRVDRLGKVGIGTASPVSKLHVYGSSSGATAYQSGNDGLIVERGGRAAVSLLSPANSDSYLFFGNPTAGNAGYVGYENTANRLVIKSSDYISLLDSTGEAVRIDGGNVGIGNTSPGAKLHVNGEGIFDDYITLGINTTDGKAGIFFDESTIAQRSSAAMYLSYDGANLSGDANRMALGSNKDGVGDILTVTYGGNVGIGTGSPSQKLDVNGIIQGSGSIRVNSAATGNPYLGLYQAGTEKAYMQYVDGTTDNLVIQSDGKVSIRGDVQYGQGETYGVISFLQSSTELAKIDQDGYMYATGFKTSGNTGFLKSDGSVDTTSYQAAGNYLTSISSSDVTTALGYRPLSGAYGSWNGLTAGSSGDWFPLFQMDDGGDGSALVILKTYAHDSTIFTVSRGFSGSNQNTISVLNSVNTPNSGYATVDSLRVRNNGWVEAKLVWSSGPTVQISVHVLTGDDNQVSIEADLEPTQLTDTVNHTVSVNKRGLLHGYTIESTGDITSGAKLIAEGKLFLESVDSNTTSTSALVLNSTEVEQRTLGSNAFTSTSYLPTAGGTMTGTLTVTEAALLKRYVSTWTNANTHDILYNGWTSDFGDYVYLKAQGNSTSAHGMLIVGDNKSFIGRSDVETGAVNSGLDQTWAEFSNGASKFTGQVSVNNRTAISVGHWSATNNTTGAIRITLPGSHGSNWSMIVLRITVYEYNSTAHTIYYVSGHDWTSGWYNNGVTKIGTGNKNIKLGYDSDKDYVILGETNSTWSYGHVTVDVMAHPSFYNSNMDITSGWDVRQTTDLSGITTQSVTNKRVLTTSDEGSGNGIDADTVDGIQAASFLRSDANDTASGIVTFTNNAAEPLAPIHITGGGNHTGLYINPAASKQAHVRFATNGTLKWQIRAPFQDGADAALKFYSWVNSTDKFVFNHDGSASFNGGTVWTSANDGASSGLDADTVDGKHASEFLTVTDFLNRKYSLPSGGGVITWDKDAGELSGTDRYIWIPVGDSGAEHINLETSDSNSSWLISGISDWEIVYYRAADSDFTSNQRISIQPADLSVVGYTSYVPNKNDLVICFMNGDDDKIYMADGRVISPGETSENPNGLATESYVTTQISNLVDSAPGTLDTLNELAAALGDDASFSTTMSTALGNRLRIDVNNQSLTSTQKSNGRTNLGLGSAATSASTDFVAVSGDYMSGNLGIQASNPTFPLEVGINNAQKVQKVGYDGHYQYRFTSSVDQSLTLTCGSYYQAEVIITAHQTNGGTYNNLYIRGIWSNNHTSHHWDEIENIGGLSGSSFTITNSQNDVENSGKLVIAQDYTDGSFAQLVVRVIEHYGTHSYTTA